MMGRSHAMCGLIFGASTAAVLDHAPLLVRLLVIPVAGGAALRPDIDHPSSRVARSLGFITKTIAKGVAAASLQVYHATCGEKDVVNRRSGHRTFTHTVPGCFTFGVLDLIAIKAHPIAGTVLLALLIGLLAQGFRSIGTGFTLAGAGLAWWTLTHYPGWWWLWPTLGFTGALVHVAGDWCTNSGVPLFWPLNRGGKRWGLIHAPLTFSTGTAVETELVTPVLVLMLVVAGGFTMGVPQFIFAAVTR